MGLFHHHGSVLPKSVAGAIRDVRDPHSVVGAANSLSLVGGLASMKKSRRQGLVPIGHNALTSHAIWGSANDPHSLLGAGVDSTGVGALIQAEDRRGHNAGLSDTQQMSAIGTGGYTFKGDFQNAQAQRAAQEDQRNAETEQNRVDQAIAELHAAYGIGGGAEAAYNHGAIEGDYGNYARDFIAANTNSAQQGFDTSQRNARFWAADHGQSGGSVDAGNQQANLQGLLGQQSAIAAQARSGVDALRSQDQAAMLQGQGDILGGTSADESILNGLTSHSQQLGAARAAIPFDAAGQLASYGGSLVSQNAQAQGFYNGGGYGGGYPSYGMPGDSTYNPYSTPQNRSPGLFGRGSSGATSITG